MTSAPTQKIIKSKWNTKLKIENNIRTEISKAENRKTKINETRILFLGRQNEPLTRLIKEKKEVGCILLTSGMREVISLTTHYTNI